jgi:hypothetical protein
MANRLILFFCAVFVIRHKHRFRKRLTTFIKSDISRNGKSQEYGGAQTQRL